MEQVFREVKEEILRIEGDVYVAALCVSIQDCLVQKLLVYFRSQVMPSNSLCLFIDCI